MPVGAAEVVQNFTVFDDSQGYVGSLNYAAPRGASSPASREALRIKEALRVSEAMGHLGSGNADDAWLSERFGVNATRLESVQRIHTYGAHCTERQKPVEILLLDPTLSEAVTVSSVGRSPYGGASLESSPSTARPPRAR